MIVFLILNLIENIIHFSIGRNIDNKNSTNIIIELHEFYDGHNDYFSILQALLTYYGLKYL